MAETEKHSKRSSICLVRWWFGELPPHWDCLMRSLAGNPDIDWLVLTDLPNKPKAPPNVRFKHITFEKLKELFSSKLGFPVNLPRHDLLPIFKPAFGFFFEEDLAGYDFWGCCDFDIIFGDLRKFLREDILAEYDKVLCRGHLTLYRNNPKVNRYFMLDCPGVKNYRQAFQGGVPYQFDEWHGIYLILRYHGIPQYHEEFIVDIKQPTRWKYPRFEGWAIQNYPEQVFYWYKGKVFHAHFTHDRGIVDEEYAYIHFQKRPIFAPKFDPYAVDGFLITPEGFFPYAREPLTPEDFTKYNRELWRPWPELKAAAFRGLRRRLGLEKQ